MRGHVDAASGRFLLPRFFGMFALSSRTLPAIVLLATMLLVADGASVAAQLQLTVDRDSGQMTLVNNSTASIPMIAYQMTTAAGALRPLAWTSIAKTGDADSGGSIDADDVWYELTQPALFSTNLAEATIGELAVDPGFQLPLGPAWVKSPHEDLVMILRDTVNATVPVDVVYAGNGGLPFVLGDCDTDGLVDGRDFLWWQRWSSLLSVTGTLDDWQQNFGSGAGLPATIIAEPSSSDLGSAVVAVAIVGRVVRRLAPRRRV